MWNNANETKPETTFTGDWYKSKPLVGLFGKYDLLIVYYEHGINEDGVEWEQWWSTAFDDSVEIDHWTDVIPELPEL